MFFQNLKQTFRSLWRYKSFSMINLLGLAIGMAAVALIYLIADYETGFDQFHKDPEAIYRVVSHSVKGTADQYEAPVPYPAARYLRTEEMGIKATEIHFANDANIRIDHRSPFEEKNIVFADSLFFKVFNFSEIEHFVIAGDPEKALSEPNKVILTESTARRYFGFSNAIGKVFTIDIKTPVEVAAIIKDIPSASHLPVNMLVSYASLTNEFIGGLDLNNWGFRGNGYCYVRTDAQHAVASIERSIQSINQKNSTSDRDKRVKYYLQPLRSIHFDPSFDASNPSYTVSPKYLTMLLLLGGFILLIACVNYINLSTSLAFTRSKEVGIHKTIGASRKQLFIRYLSETLLLTFVAAIIGLGIASVTIPLLNQLLDKHLSAEQWMTFSFITKTVATIAVISIISGCYPSLILSGFKPIESLKNNTFVPGRSSTILRKGLVVFQFTISCALIICTMVIARQMHYFNSKSLGFNKDAVVEVSLPVPDSAKIESFRSLLQNQTGIQNLSFCLGAPISDNGISTSMKAPEFPDKADYSVKILAGDLNYLSTYDIPLVAGRWFMSSEERSLGTGLVINEALVKLLGYKNPQEALGKKITIGLNNYNPPVIGVVKNFHTTSLHQDIGPVALLPFPFFYYAAGIKMTPGSLRQTLPKIEQAFKQVYPDYVYQVHFIDEELAKRYLQETRNYNLFKAFSVISIFICCIGLWGLIAFVVARKTKEIGIRKVLGATTFNLVGLLSADFLKLVVLGLVVASPLAWYFMNQWLQNFAYRVSVSWWIFGAAGILALFIALLTVSIQAVKAALANPVKNLRTE